MAEIYKNNDQTTKITRFNGFLGFEDRLICILDEPQGCIGTDYLKGKCMTCAKIKNTIYISKQKIIYDNISPICFIVRLNECYSSIYCNKREVRVVIKESIKNAENLNRLRLNVMKYVWAPRQHTNYVILKISYRSMNNKQSRVSWGFDGKY